MRWVTVRRTWSVTPTTLKVRTRVKDVELGLLQLVEVVFGNERGIQSRIRLLEEKLKLTLMLMLARLLT